MTVTRRDFLKVSFTAGGASLVASWLEGCAPEMIPAPLATPVSTPTSAPQPPFQPNLHIRIAPDGAISLIIHRSEMGQGVRTSLAMILAEELDADWSAIRVEQMDAQRELNQVTSGSGSVIINYDALRQAGATARALLIQAAAQSWGVSADECNAENSLVTHTASGKQLGYGELVSVAKDLKLDEHVTLKNPADFKLIGTSLPRVDEVNIVTGKAVYGLDVRLPGMLFTTVARPPVQGAKLVSYNAAAAQAVRGVRQVIEAPSGVAVVAENSWAAMQGRAALNIQWEAGSLVSLSSESIRQKMMEAVNKAAANEAPVDLTTLEAIYETPYLAHAAMEPVNCAADVRADHCDIWAPTQNPQDVQTFVQNRVGVPTDVHVTLLGGGFGRKLEVDYPIEAAEISKAIGGPVQVVWTREDDIQHDFYRQATVHWLKAGWDAQGNLGLWRHYMAGQGINGVAYRVGKEVLEEGLPVLYDIPQSLSQSFLINTPVPTGPWRGVMSAPNAFANECFLDEVAAALQKDPLALRLELLPETNPVRAVLELAAEKFMWSASLPEGHGRGIAAQIYHRTIVGMAAEASVEGAALRVHKVVCALNCGRVIHPDMVKQQVEGSIAFGLTSLFNEITIDKGRVQQSNFHDYPLLQLKEMPDVEVYIVPSDAPPQGLGEMGVPPIVPAVLNAVFQATGKRIRHTPIRAEDLQA
jgi:isoquinoline 1-oxidoreductase subunit beta